ncbi:hypothetical protein BGW80DRAFT_1463796 [Lactifluus volemus]|nr:hypothetical protein BGW80DRAFT_1463796 [Lactifluus volemus]
MSGAKVPESSSAQFDALIELLATEDTGENSNFHIVPEGTASTGLRDGNGKLDYAKIRSLFLQRQGSDDVNRVPFSDPASHHEPSSGIKLPQIVVEEPTAVIEVPVIPTVQPQQRVVESGKLETIPTILKDDDAHHQSVLSPEASKDFIVQHLEDALSKANEEVGELRRQVLQLESQATKLFQLSPPQGKEERDLVGPHASTARPETPNIEEVLPTEPMVPTLPTGVDVSDAERATQFLIQTDELVWRRTRYPNGPPAPIFSQANIDAITQRLTLWESIVRAPAR